MKDKEKLWVLFYVDVSSVDDEDVLAYCDELAKEFEHDDSVVQFIVPVREEKEEPIQILHDPYNTASDTSVTKKLETVRNLIKEIKSHYLK